MQWRQNVYAFPGGPAISDLSPIRSETFVRSKKARGPTALRHLRPVHPSSPAPPPFIAQGDEGRKGRLATKGGRDGQRRAQGTKGRGSVAGCVPFFFFCGTGSRCTLPDAGRVASATWPASGRVHLEPVRHHMVAQVARENSRGGWTRPRANSLRPLLSLSSPVEERERERERERAW